MQTSVSNDIKDACFGVGIDVQTRYQNLKQFFGCMYMTVAHQIGQEYRMHMKEF